MGLRFCFFCPYCHLEIEGNGEDQDIAPPPPCSQCGVWWAVGEIDAVEAGPPGSHCYVSSEERDIYAPWV